MQDISGFGLQLVLKASVTFPEGFVITEFADDSDPFDVPSIQIAETAMGPNGDMVRWSKANPIKISVGVIPGGNDDKNLSVLFEQNRVGKGKNGARDIITLTGIYPDGTSVTVSQGVITDGMPANSLASSSRLKSKVFSFSFENLTKA